MADGSQTQPPRKRTKRRLIFADLWCGGGGTSTGAKRAMRELGQPFDLVAVNHWPIAIETHTRNHPEGRHHCADLESARPIRLVHEGRLDLLMASPTCTFHSRARGGKPVHDQQRMDPWHVVRWCTELRVARILIENVPEFQDWGPCSLVTGRPIPSRKGEYFRAWLAALKDIGFRLDYRVLCCADYGDPTTRERFFLIGCSDGKALRWPEPTHAPGGSVDLFRTLPRWRSAAEIIDWSLPGRSIFNRKRPLKPNTIRRILSGAIRYSWPQPYVDALQALLDGKTPQLNVSAADAEPLMVRLRGTQPTQIAASASGCDVPLPTLTAGGGHASLVMAIGSTGAARQVDQPVPTITAGGNGASPQLITPLVMGVSSSARSRSTCEPLPTITTGGGSSEQRPGNARPQLIEPIIVTRNNCERGRLAREISEPLPTTTTAGGGFLAAPFLVPNFGERDGQIPRTHDIGDPLPTITATGHQQIATPLIAPYYGGGSGLTCGSTEDPLPTATTKARFGLVDPILMRASHSDSDGRDPASRLLDSNSPLPTLTGGGDVSMAQAFVLPVTHAGVRPVHDIDEPLKTITGAKRGELALVQRGVGCTIDIHYRMLHWRELARGMSFDEPGAEYQFAGNGTQITTQIGNAVPCRTAQALVHALMDIVTP